MDIHNNNFIFDAQQEVVALLSSDCSLSSIPVLAENILDIDFQIKNALAKQGLVAVVMTPTATYIGDLASDGRQLAYELDDFTVLVSEYLPINRAANKLSGITALDAAVKIANILGKDNHGAFVAKKIEMSESDNILAAKATFKCQISTK